MPTLLPGRADGFSLLEIILVLVLMGMAAAVVAPSFVGGLRGLQVETEARDLITRMKQARTQAISKQQVFRIILYQNIDGSHYYYSLTNDFEEEIRRFPLPDSLAVVLDSRLEFPLRISFYPNGRSSGGRFTLRNQAGKQLNIEVDSVTGFARTLKEGA